MEEAFESPPLPPHDHFRAIAWQQRDDRAAPFYDGDRFDAHYIDEFLPTAARLREYYGLFRRLLLPEVAAEIPTGRSLAPFMRRADDASR